MPVISIGGPPGSGTTTTAELLEDSLGMRYIYAGRIFRVLAKERNMSLEDFGRYVNAHPEVDREIERYQVEEARKGDVILEGRVTGYILRREGVESFRVWITAEEGERARRVATRESGDVEAVRAANREREANEAARYISNYGFDVTDMTIYDLVLDNTEVPAGEVARRVESAFRERYPDWKGGGNDG